MYVCMEPQESIAHFWALQHKVWETLPCRILGNMQISVEK